MSKKFTILVIPDDDSETSSYSFSKFFIKIAIVFSLITILVSIAIIVKTAPNISKFDSLNKNSGLLFEFLNTTNCCIDPPYQADNYYWNYQYRSGWRYKDNIVGNAFVNPINNDNNVKEKIKLAHVGAYFNTKNMKLHLLTSRKIHLSDSLKTKFNINY